MSWPASLPWERTHILCTTHTALCDSALRLRGEPANAMDSLKWNLLLSVCFQCSSHVAGLPSRPGACGLSHQSGTMTPRSSVSLQGPCRSWSWPSTPAHSRDSRFLLWLPLSHSALVTTLSVLLLPLPEGHSQTSHQSWGSSPSEAPEQWRPLRPGVPGVHPGEQRLKGWRESDQGPPQGTGCSSQLLLTKATARLQDFSVREGPFSHNCS